MQFGKFIQDKEGKFHGTIGGYGMPKTSVLLAPQTSRDGKPYFEIIGDPANAAFDGGVAYPKKKGNLEYLSVVMDSPVFSAPIYAALFQDKTNPETYNLIWDRPEPKSAITEENIMVAQANAGHAPPSKSSFFRGGQTLTL